MFLMMQTSQRQCYLNFIVLTRMSANYGSY